MKKLFFIFILMGMCSCGDYIDKPKNLIPKDQMAEILADLAINEQATYINPNSNLEAGTRYVLKTHHIKAEDFTASFKYYVVKEKMQGITEDAQKIVLKKDPKADQYVKDKKSKTGEVQPPPVLSR